MTWPMFYFQAFFTHWTISGLGGFVLSERPSIKLRPLNSYGVYHDTLNLTQTTLLSLPSRVFFRLKFSLKKEINKLTNNLAFGENLITFSHYA